MLQPQPDSDELARFRAEWREEVERRKAATSATATNDEPPRKFDIPLPTPAAASKATIVSDFPNAPRSASQSSALADYRSAVENEQRGDLDEALRLYRIAFRKDPSVDRLYYREEIISSAAAIKRHTDHGPVAVSKDRNTFIVATKTLAKVIAGFPEHLAFDPEVEEESVPLNGLPDEILVRILLGLDPTSLERFGAVSRKARVFTLDSAIWRELVHATYKPPQLADQTELDSAIARCLYDFRRVYIEQPRVRMDGVYISVCHYVRAGLSDNSWVNINHLITYHRYLRFFPNGQVISLRTNEEHPPQEVIPMLKPSLRMKGLFFGRWRLVEDTVYITNLIEATGHLPISIDSELTEIVFTHSETVRYVFTMSLHLRSRPVGRWNRLEISAFDSVKVATGDISPVVTKHERPFWFSKVRSYA
ncbi:hypothetical protein BDZ89DRAFT_1108514 [Hymenopellis radicata]|nr:hypothetical protein BDZ89DRAFT_1108514 [Hymenopellis radicata]